MSTPVHTPLPVQAGQSFRDRHGQRWWVQGRRPGSRDQFVIEAEMKGSYRRVALYVMTEPEFRERARAEALEPERGSSRLHPAHPR